jgi:hypothetical protein
VTSGISGLLVVLATNALAYLYMTRLVCIGSTIPTRVSSRRRASVRVARTSTPRLLLARLSTHSRQIELNST